jgi:LCP family protein required for cell wall assembly
VQRAVLVLNVLVVLACFVGAAALLVAKRVRESFVAAPKVTYADDTTAPATVPPSTVAVTGPAPPTVAATSTAPPETFPDPDPQAMNFLITGSDNNACLDPNSPYAGAVANREDIGNRSDTIMVLRLDPTTRAAAILSFQRDLWVDIPGRADGRINTTYQKGQYDLMARTLDKNFAVKIDHFVQIDFCAFKQIVDAVGGVSVPLTNPIRDANTGLNILDVSQCHEFTGDEALAYVRSRHLQYQDADGTWRSDGTSDLGRIARQQDFLRRMLQAASEHGLFDPKVVRGLIDTVQKYVVFDEGFSIDDMLKFAGLLREIPPSTIHTYQVQASPATKSGQAVLVPQINGPNMKAILDIFRGTAPLAGATEQVDDTTTTAATTTSSSVVATTTTGPTAGPVTASSPTTSASSTTSTSTSTTSTTTTVAPDATNPSDITQGIVPDKNATC